MSTGLSVQDVVNVSISLSATPAGFRNFSSFMVVGSSSVIDVVERKRLYTGINGVAQDFGTTAPEYNGRRRSSGRTRSRTCFTSADGRKSRRPAFCMARV